MSFFVKVTLKFLIFLEGAVEAVLRFDDKLDGRYRRIRKSWECKNSQFSTSLSGISGSERTHSCPIRGCPVVESIIAVDTRSRSVNTRSRWVVIHCLNL